jgi:non-ribosomal peptide synthetase component F
MVGGACLTLLCACATTPPSQEMADARAELRAAEDAGAKNIGVEQFKEASNSLSLAERELDLSDYRTARNYAIIARSAASTARKVMEALHEARKSIDDARAQGRPASDAEAAYQAAVEDARQGDIESAVAKAQQAVRLAENQP